MMNRLHIPDTDDSFFKIEPKDFIVQNRRQIGTIDVLKNYQQAHRRGLGSYQSMQVSPKRAPKRALDHANNSV